MNARAKRIRESAGKPAGLTAADEGLLEAIASMVEFATRPKSKRKAADGEGAALLVSPAHLYGEFKNRVGHIVLCEPYDKRWFGRVAATLKAMPDLQASDLDLVLDHIEAGSLATWPNGAPDFNAVIKWFPTWVMRARKWAENGRQAVGSKAVLGAPVQAMDLSPFQFDE